MGLLRDLAGQTLTQKQRSYQFTKKSIADLFYTTYHKLERLNIVTMSENFSQAPKRYFTSRKELRTAGIKAHAYIVYNHDIFLFQ